MRIASILMVLMVGPWFGPVLAALPTQEELWKQGDPWPYPKPKVIADVEARVKVFGSTFTYSYAIFSHPGNPKDFPLCGFEIDLRHEPEKGHPYGYVDLTEKHDSGEHDFLLRKTLLAWEERAHPIPQSPAGWMLSRDDPYATHNYEAMWVPSTECHQGGGVGPRARGESFKLMASLPPGVRDFSIDIFPIYAEEMIRRVWETQGEKKYYHFQLSPHFANEWTRTMQLLGRTLAPVAAPEPFTASSWTARMLADAGQARGQGWIKSDGQLAEIKSLIEGLKASKKRKLKSAVRKIERYVEGEVKAGRLSGEADALVRLNALYFLRRVEQDPKILKGP